MLCWSVSASSRPPAVPASAYGTSPKPGLSSAFCDHWLPVSAVAASGENVRSWLGRKPAISDVAPVAAMTIPPLLATPGGVASFHVLVPAGRTNSSQKLLCAAAEPPIWTIAQLAPPLLDTDVASAGPLMTAALARLAADGAAGALPQAARISAAPSATPPARALSRGLILAS